MSVPVRTVAAVVLLAVATSATPVFPDSVRDGQEPPPWRYEEFPQWAWDLRRGEIVAIGTFPIALILSSVVYEVGRFTLTSIQNQRIDAETAPFFFSPGGGEPFNQQERIGLIIGSAAISLGVALADYLLGRRERDLPENW